MIGSMGISAAWLLPVRPAAANCLSSTARSTTRTASRCGEIRCGRNVPYSRQLSPPGRCSAERGTGPPSLSPHPFPGTSRLPPLRSGRVRLDRRRTLTAQSEGQRRYAPMVFGFSPEHRSASLRKPRSPSPESAAGRVPGVPRLRSARTQKERKSGRFRGRTE